MKIKPCLVLFKVLYTVVLQDKMLNIFKILFRLHDLGQFSQNFVRFSKIVASFCILRILCGEIDANFTNKMCCRLCERKDIDNFFYFYFYWVFSHILVKLQYWERGLAGYRIPASHDAWCNLASLSSCTWKSSVEIPPSGGP